MSRSCFEGIDEASAPRLDLAPLIDMSFLMLIFFLVAAALQRQEADLAVVLPGADSATASLPTPVEQLQVDIDRHGIFRVNRQVLSVRPGEDAASALTDRLRRYAAVAAISGAEPRVTITCAAAAVEQRFIDALNACRSAGITRIGLTE